MDIGFIGLGIMGSRMAANLQKAGYQLAVYNRTPDKAAALVEKGAELAPSLKQLAQKSRIVFTMLSTPEAVEETALGPDGFLEYLAPDSLWVNCSTINPSFTLKMVQHTQNKGHRYLDAPVAGSLVPAEKGELIFYVGGNQQDLQQVQELLDIMGKATVYIGENGQGSSMKMVNNMIMGQAMAAFAEALKLGTSLGIPEEIICQTILNGPTAAPVLKQKERKLLQKDFSPEFPLEWMHKDLHLANITAYERAIALPLLNATKELYAQAKEKGLGSEDISAVYKFIQADKS